MKKILIIISLWIISLFVTPAYAYCIYNLTIGNETVNYSNNKSFNQPTVILFTPVMGYRKPILQTDYHCDLDGDRSQNGMHVVDVYLVNAYLGRYVNSNSLLSYDLACRVPVFNKGGYVLVKGSKGNIQCKVYREKQ